MIYIRWLVGVDIYDCVLVLRTQKAVDAFRHVRWTVGGELSAVAGPYGAGGYVETELHKRQAPIFTYLKSRGFYAGVQVDGTVVIERTDENERFYGSRLSCTDILAGKARHAPIRELRMLKATLKAAQGDNVDESALPSGPAPADHQVEESGHVFGVPDKEDPDPFGVHAMEQEGLKLNDAATHAPAPEQELEFHPSEQSPIYPVYNKVKPEEKKRESLRKTYKLPPAYSGPRTNAPEGDPEASRSPRNSIDTGTQTVDMHDGSPMHERKADGVEMLNPSDDQDIALSAVPNHATIGKRAPPALPPRATIQQPIELEDNDPLESSHFASQIEPLPQDVGSSGPPTITTLSDPEVSEVLDVVIDDEPSGLPISDAVTTRGYDAAASSEPLDRYAEEAASSSHRVPGRFE